MKNYKCIQQCSRTVAMKPRYYFVGVVYGLAESVALSFGTGYFVETDESITLTDYNPAAERETD